MPVSCHSPCWGKMTLAPAVSALGSGKQRNSNTAVLPRVLCSHSECKVHHNGPPNLSYWEGKVGYGQMVAQAVSQIGP